MNIPTSFERLWERRKILQSWVSLRNRSLPSLSLRFLKRYARLPYPPTVCAKVYFLTVGFLCLGNTEIFKSETEDAQQIITSALRGDSVSLKRTILEIFQDYFAIEEYKAEALEGREKEDVDLSADIGVLTGTAKNINTDEYPLESLF
jgi:hypothetical protein